MKITGGRQRWHELSANFLILKTMPQIPRVRSLSDLKIYRHHQMRNATMRMLKTHLKRFVPSQCYLHPTLTKASCIENIWGARGRDGSPQREAACGEEEKWWWWEEVRLSISKSVVICLMNNDRTTITNTYTSELLPDWNKVTLKTALKKRWYGV